MFGWNMRSIREDRLHSTHGQAFGITLGTAIKSSGWAIPKDGVQNSVARDQ